MNLSVQLDQQQVLLCERPVRCLLDEDWVRYWQRNGDVLFIGKRFATLRLSVGTA
jgi:hypothetical protein